MKISKDYYEQVLQQEQNNLIALHVQIEVTNLKIEYLKKKVK